MNERDRLDRMLTAWTEDAWSPPPPAYLGEVLARTKRIRQRPAWASLERWLPMELTLRRPMLATPLRLLAIIVALLLLLIAAMSVPLLFGSRSLPAMVATPQFRNGLVAWGKVGDIWVVDPAVGEPRVLIGGMASDDWPDWSPDGTRIAFIRTVGTGVKLMVANADGSDVREVTSEVIDGLDWTNWSPDGSRFVIGDASGSLSLVSSGGGPLQPLNLGFDARQPSWHPDGRSLLVRVEATGGRASEPDHELTTLRRVFLPDDLSGADKLRSEVLARSDATSPFFLGDRGRNDLMEASYSPDGSRITYIQGQLTTDGTYGVFGGPDTRNHVMHADGSGSQMVELSPESDYEDGAWFSPDGTRLSMIIRKGDYHQVAIMNLDGSTPPVVTDPEADPNAMPAWWSPDGTQVLAVRIADGVTSLIDPDTGARTVQPWQANWADWQPVPVTP